MTKIFTNNFAITNLYQAASEKSEIVTQMIYGDHFEIIKKKGSWYKIKIKEDGYIGFVLKKTYQQNTLPSHKVSSLKANVYKHPNRRKIIYKLPFGSKIKVYQKKLNYYKFEKGWVNKKDLKTFNFKDKDIFKKILLFKNVKYKWGGKTFKGIDCSGLVQIFFNYNNLYCPRDAKDQEKFFRLKININKLKKNDLVFWKGHVAIILSKQNLIHAYGPMKKTIIMNIFKTIKRIKKTANLNVTSLKRIN